MSDNRPKCEIPDCSVKADDYKCFRGELTGFEQFKQINLIIGKNNTGKSALIDLVEMICPPSSPRMQNLSPDMFSSGTAPVHIFYRLKIINKIAEQTRINTESPIVIEWMFHSYKNNQMEINLITPKLETISKRQLFASMRDSKTFPTNPLAAYIAEYDSRVDSIFKLPLKGRALFRLEADRNLEATNPSSSMHLRTKGQDFVSLYHKHGTDGKILPLGLLEKIEQGIADILGDEIDLTRVQTATIRDQMWDIYLSERNKQPIPISDSGSGLKTILLTLAYLHLLPSESPTPTNRCIFCLEELENNLHPSAQRRLFKYLLNFVRDNGCMLFLTTHSNVAIDIFSKCSDEEAQILHVTHDGTRASVDTIEPQKLGHVLDDLGYQASDILQSNYLIWVEGPSDRIYITHSLKKDHDLEEGVHYSIMFYGGRLLSHLDFDGTAQWDEEAVNELIDLAKINRNSAIVLDSDKSEEGSSLNGTKNRIIEAFTAGDNDKCFAWVTAGREVENYVSPAIFKEAVDAVHSDTDWKAITLNQYSQRTVRKKAKGKKSFIDKVKVARKLCESEKLSFEHDWNERIKELADKIHAANGM